jgi:RNA polymerase sigma-70 factor (ECF subfamily)
MEESFDQAYREYAAPVFGFLARMTGDRGLAEEICQETFVRFLEHRSRLRGGNGAVASWLYRVATRLVLDRKRRRPVLPLDREPTDVNGAGHPAEEREIRARVRDEIGRLPPVLRATYLLRAHQELTWPQIADALGVSDRAAKDRFRRARDLLTKRLSGLIREIRA